MDKWDAFKVKNLLYFKEHFQGHEKKICRMEKNTCKLCIP